MIVANDVSREGCGFGSDTNIVTIYRKDGFSEIPEMSKESLSDVIFDHILRLEESYE